jgi:hypothetical protein
VSFNKNPPAPARSAQDLLVSLKRCEHDHVRRIVEPAHGGRGRDAVHLWHPDVHQDDIGSMCSHGGDGLGAVGGFANDLQLIR